MNLQSIRTRAGAAAIAVASLAIASNAQTASNAHSSAATHASAEMTKGKLNPANSKPGDMVALKLKDDVRSNGEIVLKKGTMITGVVRNVNHAEGKGQAQSMVEVEWLVPPAQGRSVQGVSIALQSITQLNPIYQSELDSTPDDLAARPVRAGGPMSNGLLGSANVALLSMPSVVAVDHQTSSTIESGLGSSSSGQLFKVGHGQLVNAGGSQQSVDLFSHLSNDTVITSPSKNFEISSGAQMQLLVGVNKK